MRTRKTGFDLLRIIAMLMILTRHFMGWGGVVNNLTPSNFNYFWVMPLYFVCGIGNSLFFLLAGFFASKPRLSKVVYLERKVWIYSFVITVVVFLTGINNQIGIKEIINSIFPILSNRYWFLSVYLVLYIVGYAFIKGLDSMSESKVLIVILVLLVNNVCITDAQYTLLEGLLAFVIGYYIRRSEHVRLLKSRIIFMCYGCLNVLYMGERVLVSYLDLERTQFDIGLRYILTLLSAVALFLVFEKICITHDVISKISNNVLAVYLISCNPALVPVLYDTFLHATDFLHSKLLFVYYLVVNTMIFVVCVSVDKIVSWWVSKEVGLYQRLKLKVRIKNDGEGRFD